MEFRIYNGRDWVLSKSLIMGTIMEFHKWLMEFHKWFIVLHGPWHLWNSVNDLWNSINDLWSSINDLLADFKCGVTFNTHGNTNRSVYPSPSTQSKMLTSRPTQMLAMVLHFLKMCVLLNQIMFVIVKNSNMLGRWFLTNNLFQFIDTYHSYQIFH